MTSDRTQHQSTESQQRAQELSRGRSAAPIEIEGYETRRFLGAGAYGEVWVALDQNTGRRVAIKYFTHRSETDWSNLSSEVEKLVFLSADRYVVQVLDVGWDSTPPYFVMEYVENGSLENHLEANGPLPVGQAVEIFREVAIGLSRAHGKGVLHCDLKPANILLDQDNLPRLADFGQSRLSHEQRPALGTLFYMAPEQADLEAVPDARWDVYALGALLHTMLTGEPPRRHEDAVKQIDSTQDLPKRLTQYRQLIEAAPPLLDSKLEGVDRSLLSIMERCLAVDPDERFPNVQSVMNALVTRDQMRDRRPLVILGLVGPLLFLLVTSLFAWRNHQRAVGDASYLLRQRAQQSNGFAADFVAEAVARRIENYFQSVEELAQSPEYIAMFRECVEDEELSELLSAVRGRAPTEDSRERELLQSHPIRQPLQKLMDDLVAERDNDEIASWFTTDAHGVHVASAFDSETDVSPVGGDYSYRTYFHGGPRDDHTTNGAPITDTHFSTVFRSTATGAWKVAVSTPIRHNGEFLGIVALTVELGRLGKLLGGSEAPHQFNVLVDGRRGETYGVILQHPLLTSIRAQGKNLGEEFSQSPEYRVPLDTIDGQSLYSDPLGNHPEGKNYQHKWVVAKREVKLRGDTARKKHNLESGFVVLVQENYDLAADTVRNLGDSLLRQSIVALGSVVSLLLLLWYLVRRALTHPDDVVRKQGRLTTRATTINSMETIELPRRMQIKP